MKATEKRQVRRLEIDARFELAGLAHEYQSGYRLLSAEAHNSPSNAVCTSIFESILLSYERGTTMTKGPRVLTLSGSMMVLETVIKVIEKPQVPRARRRGDGRRTARL